MNIYKERFNNLIRDNTLRIDPKYHILQRTTGWNIFQSESSDLISLSQILEQKQNLFEYEEGKEYKGVQTGSQYIDVFGNIADYIVVKKEDHPDRVKYRVEYNDILISSLRYAKVPVVTFNESSVDLDEYVFSNGFYILNVKGNWEHKFVYRLLKTKKLRQVLDENLSTGIGISNYKIDDLLKISIPNVTLQEQRDFLIKIKPLEDKIKELSKRILDPQKVIDRFFSDEFDLSVEELKNQGDFELYNISLSELCNNVDLRNSPKFHKRKRIFIEEKLQRLTNKKIKDFLLEPATLGFSAKSHYFDEDADTKYITMAELKNWELDLEDVKTLGSEYKQKAKATNKLVNQDDILMCRSGEGTIGKVAHVNEVDDFVYADFVMRIRLKNYLPRFAYYYFRTTYFQSLIEIHKKGLGNNTNIYPKDIQEFPLLDITVEKQEGLIRKLENIFNEQDKIMNEIEELNLEIDNRLMELLR